MAESPEPTESQRKLIELLRDDRRAKDAYLEALYALQQDEYPGRMVHFAHSLREVIDHLARRGQTERDLARHIKGSGRKAGLERLAGPVVQEHSADLPSERLVEMYDQLSRVAHHREAMPIERAREALSKVEEALHSLFRLQLEINLAIDDILQKPPSLALAEKLVALQRYRLQTQSHLVSKLPVSWLKYMNEAGFFENPPPASEDEYRRWAPAIYLQRCAKASGEYVAGIIASCGFKAGEKPNPAIYMDFLLCAAGLAAADMEKVGRKALDENWDRFMGWDLFAVKYFEVAEKLYLEGRYDVSACMLYRALKPKLSEPATGADGITEWPRPVSQFYVHMFSKTLRKMPALAQKHPRPIIKLLDRLLYKSIVLDNQGMNLDEDYDDGGRWRAAIEESDQNNMASTPSLFVSCIRDCIVRAVRDGDGTEEMKILYCRNHRIYRRLELYIYAEFPDRFKKEVELSASWYFDCAYAHHEYYRLLETAFPALPDRARQEILDRIEAGYDPARFEALKQDHGEAWAAGAEKQWKLRLLEPIKHHLDERRKKIREELIKEMGKPRHPAYLSYTEVFSTETDPDPFEGKNADEAIEIAQNYEPPESLVHDYDAAEAFRKYVKANPLECSKQSKSLERAHPRMQHGLFSGLSDVVERGASIEWSVVLPLARDVAVRLSGGQNTSEEPEPNTPEWYRLQTDALYDPLPPLFLLVENGFKKDALDFNLRREAWGVVEELVRVGDAYAEPSDYPDKTGSLHMSLNSLNGVSFHIVYRYAAWCEGHGEALAPEAKQVFDAYLNEKESHTVYRHAVLGVFFTHFHSLDKEWARSLPQRALSSKENKIAFWDGYVYSNPLYTFVFDDLHEWYNEFMNKNLVRDLPMASIYETTIRHVMIAYFYDLEKADGIVETFLRNPKPEYAERCVGQVDLILRGEVDEANFNKDKLISLWKHPSFKDLDLGGWFLNSPLDKKTAIELYGNHMKHYRGKIDMAHDPVDRLLECAKDFPLEVAECLETIIHKYEYEVPDKARDVFKMLLECNDQSVKDACVRIAEKAAQIDLGWDDLPPKD